MRNARTMSMLSLAAMILLPAVVAAQATPASWSRVILDHRCHPEGSCAPRQGMVWQDSNPMPRYPEVMRQVRIAGKARITFDVGTDGAVDPSSIVVSNSTNKAFDVALTVAARNWKFGAEAPDRPDKPVRVDLDVVFAITTGCKVRSETAGQSAWMPGTEGTMLVITSGCPYTIPRDEVRPIRKG